MQCSRVISGFTLGFAALAGFLVLAVPAVAAPPAAAEDGNVWHGMRPLTGGKGYVQTPMGQVHYRDVGPRGGMPILLLHQSPWSMVEFADIQNALAARGWRAITVDTPGYGMSDAPPNTPSMADLADNLVPVLDGLGIRSVLVAGHHTGASIAVAFAARHPERVTGLILHGVPLYSAQERATLLARPETDRTLKVDGSHLSDYFKFVVAAAADTPANAFRNLRNATWAVLTLYLPDQDIGHAAAFSYDMAPDLDRIRVPTLVLSDRGDSLNRTDRRVVELHPKFKYIEFSKGRLLSLMSEPDRWAGIAADFAASISPAAARAR
jgi:pimeloyl-ACP methyl ester carboxylesterase